jgi:hypothetical protein
MDYCSLNHILATMERTMLPDDTQIRAELEKMEDGDLIAVWLRSRTLTLPTRQQQLAYREIGRRGLAR